MRALLFISISLLLFSCKKTKLKDEYYILEGKWKWVSGTETRTVLSNGNTVYFYHDASDYPDDYFIEFDRKGEVRFYKNDHVEISYRLVINNFSENCNNFPNCNFFGILYDNDKDKSITGFVGQDSLLISSQHSNLPLIYHVDDDFSYDYQHKFVKVN